MSLKRDLSRMMGNYHVRFGKGCLYPWANNAGYKYLVHIRLELAAPGVQFLQGDHQLFNVIITAHAFIMIFFMVKLCCLLYLVKNINIKYLKHFNNLKKISLNNKTYHLNKYLNYNLRNKNQILNLIFLNGYSTSSSDKNIEISTTKKINLLSYDITQHIIIDPFNNRSSIAKIAKKSKGIYIFEALNTNKMYVGSSINLYSRVISYFRPSILAKADRYVLRYFRKYGFNNVKLTLYIMNNLVTVKDILSLEEYFINQLSKDNSLNIETVSGSGYHKPMSDEARLNLRKIRGQPFYVYDIQSKSLIFLFESKQFAYDQINIDHRTLENCLYNGELFLNKFLFSIEPINEFVFEALISLEELKMLIKNQRFLIKSIQFNSKPIYVENIDNPILNKKFDSISDFARSVKGDRSTIRNYINGKKKGLYRGKWKIQLLKESNS
jgi:GIY-YIG catalytic domain/NUMOD1 domain